jgi:hypothetical protein
VSRAEVGMRRLDVGIGESARYGSERVGRVLISFGW